MHFLLYTFKCSIRFQVIIVSNFLSQIMSYDVTQENKMQKPESNMGGGGRLICSTRGPAKVLTPARFFFLPLPSKKYLL